MLLRTEFAVVAVVAGDIGVTISIVRLLMIIRRNFGGRKFVPKEKPGCSLEQPGGNRCDTFFVVRR
jgi:hypothetical protein